jgi:hypothetical protein
MNNKIPNALTVNIILCIILCSYSKRKELHLYKTIVGFMLHNMV